VGEDESFEHQYNKCSCKVLVYLFTLRQNPAMSLGLLMKVNLFNHHSNAKCLNPGWIGKLGKHVSVVIGQFLYQLFKTVLEHLLCNFNKFGPKNNWDAFKQDISPPKTESGSWNPTFPQGLNIATMRHHSRC
jgi:hypothetical protein